MAEAAGIMASPVGIVLLVVAIASSIILGTKLKVNSGFIAIAWALIIGVGISGMSVGAVSGLFKGNFFINVLLVTAFFAYPLSNGTMKVLTDKLVWKTRGAARVLPFILWAIAILVSALGGGAEGGTMFISVIAFNLGMTMGYQPVLCAGLTYLGCYAGGMVPWMNSFQICMGVFEGTFDHTTSNAICMSFWLLACTMSVVMMVLLFFGTKAYKIGGKGSAAIATEKPADFTPIQKKSLVIILITIVLVIVPTFLTFFTDAPFIMWLAKFVTIRVVAAIGIIVCCILKLADSQEVFTKRIPWGMLITVGGMMLLISTVVESGTVQYISDALTNANLSITTIKIIFFIVGVGLSFVSTGPGTVFPLCAPLSVAIGAAYGVNPVTILMPAVIGSMSDAFSPFSTGGALSLTGCPDELRDKAVKQQLAWTAIEIGVCFIFTLINLGDTYAFAFM